MMQEDDSVEEKAGFMKAGLYEFAGYLSVESLKEWPKTSASFGIAVNTH